MKSAQSTSLDLNTAFHRYHALGVTRNVRPRARVCIQGGSTQFVKVLLLVDYQTAYWDPSLASAYAVAATLVLDGLSERAYLATVNSAIRKHGRGHAGQSYRAELMTLCDLIASGRAVCAHRDEALLALIGEQDAAPVDGLPAAIKRILDTELYTGNEDIACIRGSIGKPQIVTLINQTLAIGISNFSEDRFEREAAAGENEKWRFQEHCRSAA